MRGFAISIAINALLASTTSQAAVGDCVATATTLPSTQSVREYRISTVNAGSLNGVTSTQFYRSVIAAAEVWNEQANAGSLKYGGTTNVASLPDDDNGDPLCDLPYNLVRVDTATMNASCGSAEMAPKCKDAFGAPHRFEIFVRKNAGDGRGVNEEWLWAADHPDESCTDFTHPNMACSISNECEKDLRQTLVHEFGHTFNVFHPGSNEFATMKPTDFGETLQRDLHEWDKVCAVNLNGSRDADGWRNYVSGGSIGAGVLKTSGISSYIPSFATGVHKNGATWVWGYAAQSTDEFRFIYSGNQNVESTGQYDHGPTIAVYRAWSDINTRFLYVDQDDFLPGQPDFTKGSMSRIRYERSGDFFTGTDTSGSMLVCESATSCSNPENVTSAYPLTVAYDFYRDVDISVWANQNRNDDSHDREIWISAGLIPNRTLPFPLKTGFTSSVGPGVTCKNASGTNCLYAFVEADDPNFTIRVRRFYTSGGSIVPVSGLYTVSTVNGLTANRIAAFHHNGYFYLAFKYLYTGNIVVYRSTTGTSWSLFSGNVSPTITGPTAVPYWSGNNMIGYVR